MQYTTGSFNVFLGIDVDSAHVDIPASLEKFLDLVEKDLHEYFSHVVIEADYYASGFPYVTCIFRDKRDYDGEYAVFMKLFNIQMKERQQWLVFKPSLEVKPVKTKARRK